MNKAWHLNEIIKDHPDHCYLSMEEEYWKIGVHKPIGICIKITCRDDFSYEKMG